MQSEHAMDCLYLVRAADSRRMISHSTARWNLALYSACFWCWYSAEYSFMMSIGNPADGTQPTQPHVSAYIFHAAGCAPPRRDSAAPRLRHSSSRSLFYLGQVYRPTARASEVWQCIWLTGVIDSHWNSATK